MMARPTMPTPTPIPAFPPVDRPLLPARAVVSVGVVDGDCVEVGAGVEVVVDEVVGTGGPAVLERSRRL